MLFKICVLLIAFCLFQAGQTFRLNKNANDEINEDYVKMIQDVFIKHYPQAAIDKYISVIRQLYSKVPEERKKGNFEAVVLMVEGALYRTKIYRITLSGYERHYDVRSALKRIEEASDSDEDLDELTEKNIEEAKTYLAKEFPSEVVEKITNILTKAVKAETIAERKEAAIRLTILSMDGARVITSRSGMISETM